MTDLNPSSQLFTRGTGPDAMCWDDGVRAVQRVLNAAGEAEFTDTGSDGCTMSFRIIQGERALTVRGSRGVVGVFASLPAAIQYGFGHLDRAADHQRTIRLRPTRPRRRTLKDFRP